VKAMFVLLQLYPPDDAIDDDDPNLEVLAVSETEDELTELLADYSERYLDACREFDQWDEANHKSDEWSEAHNEMAQSLNTKYRVHGSLIAETRFKIVETLIG